MAVSLWFTVQIWNLSKESMSGAAHNAWPDEHVAR
jgi:hypothetical protein